MQYSGKILNKITSKTKIYLVIIFMLLVLLCIYENMYIIPSIVVFTLLCIYTFWTNGRKKDEFFKNMQELNLGVNSAAKNNLVNSPLPLIILDTTGNVIWRNNRFIKEFINVDINTYLDDLVKEIKQDGINGKLGNFRKELKLLNKSYLILGECEKKGINKKGEEVYRATMYFLDNTNEVSVLEKYENSKTCIGIIMIDNYEELLSFISETEMPQIVAEVEKKIYEWTSSFDALTIKKEKDNFVFIFDKMYVEKMKEDKFSLLDTIKEIETSDKMDITVSIAVTDEGNTNMEKYKMAQSTMEIALGRGGDQAIVRQNENYEFFGGRKVEVEKRTKVKARMVAKALEDLIKESNKVIVLGHKNGDIDAMGASLGLFRLSKELGKDAYIVSESADITLLGFLDRLKQNEDYKDIIISKSQAINITDKNSLVIVVDTNKLGYLEEPKILEKTKNIVLIDHHRQSPETIENTSLSFQEVYASSASELVVEILQYANKGETKLKEAEIEALYGGIMVDTKDFTFKTGVRTFEAAAYLKKLGVDIIKVKKLFQVDLANYSLIADIVKGAKIYFDNIAISVYENEELNAGLICAKAADELLKISDITASFAIGNNGKKTVISGRSVGDINVQLILEKMGGGGHITVAGAQTEELSIQEAKDMVIRNIEEYLKNE